MIYYLKKFWKYMDKYLIQHCIVFILMIFGVFLTLIQPLITKNLINNIINGTNSTLIMGYIFTMAILLLLSLLNRFFQNYLIIRLSNKIMFNLKSEMFEKIQYSLISESKENRIGDLITRLTGDADSLQTFLSTYFLQIVTDLLMIIGLFSIIFSMNITIGLIVVCLVFILYVNIKIFGPLITQMSRELRVKIASMLSYIQENLTNRIFIKAYVLERNSISRFAEFYNQIIKSSEKISLFTNGIGSINNIITSGGTILIISVSASYILQKKMSVGDLVAISAFVSQIFSPVQRIADMNLNFLQFRTSMDRVLDIVNLETELTQSDREDIIFHGVIEVNNLSFRYSNENVLSDLSFKIEDGEKIKIYGRSGIGKSTLFKILIGFTDKYTGNVLIGNYDIRKITYESLRKQIIIVFQDDYFFHGSILENVNYGLNCSQNQIIEVLNLVELLGDIKNMSEEINTNIGERGSKLSGGQKQRLSIARALLRNPKILILDEATSAVSEEMERKILQNINLAYPKLTLLYVSHRNSLSEIDMKQLEIVEKIT